MENNFSNKANFIWNVANIIRDAIKRGRYQDVILPFTVLRRIDSVLAPTKDEVMEAYYEYRDKLDNLNPLLTQKSGYAFYNTSRFTFDSLLADPDDLADNLQNYIAGFSPNMREVLDNFDFTRTIERLEEEGLLFLVMERFNQIDLHPDVVPNHEMGTIFEELIRRFNEALNENPGEHFTPRDVIRLMVNLLVTPDKGELETPYIVKKVYDPCCGTGGMLTIAKDFIQDLNPQADIRLYGQEVNPETYAVCKSDLYMKDPTGKDAENIFKGSTLSEDHLAGESFAYQLANPPYGKNWRSDSQAVKREAKRGHAGRFGAGTPRISDGQLLFLQHMLSHMQGSDSGGGRVSIIMNGSPLFTGGAGSGESEIRRWILENDWLEALIALPEQLFYNTGIATYVWVLSNRKPEERRGKVMLIDASDLWAPMRKSLGDKRRQLKQEHIDEIVNLYQKEIENGRVKVFQKEEFGYRKIRVEQPMRMNYQATPERIETLKEERAFQKIAESKKRDPEKKKQEIQEGKVKQQAILEMLSEMEPKVYKNVETFREVFKTEAEKRGIKLYAATRDAIVDALGKRDEEADIMVDRQGRPEPDTDFRDYEYVPLTEEVLEYFEREVMPYVPDAWIDEDYTDEKDGKVGRVGYEINFNRYFYEYEPPRPLDEINQDIKDLQSEISILMNEVTEDG